MRSILLIAVPLITLGLATPVLAQTRTAKQADTTRTGPGRTVPPSKPARPTTVQPADEDSLDTESPEPDTLSAKEQETDEGEADSTAVNATPAEDESPGASEADTSVTRQKQQPVKAGKRSGIYNEEETEPEPAWELDARLDYDSWRIRRGLEFSRNLPSLTPSVLLTHGSGLSAEIDAMSSYGKIWRFTLWSLILGYEHEFTDWAKASIQFTRYRYEDKEENAVASKFNSWTLIGNFDARLCAIDLTFDLYPGDDAALYVTLDVSKEFELGDVTITPMFETCYLTENYQVELPPPLPPKDLSLHGFATLSLQCEIAWQATDQLALSLNPQFTHFPIIEVATKARGFATTLSVVYTFEF